MKTDSEPAIHNIMLMNKGACLQSGITWVSATCLYILTKSLLNLMMTMKTF